jgi:hypothetical protein
VPSERCSQALIGGRMQGAFLTLLRWLLPDNRCLSIEILSAFGAGSKIAILGAV